MSNENKEHLGASEDGPGSTLYSSPEDGLRGAAAIPRAEVKYPYIDTDNNLLIYGPSDEHGIEISDFLGRLYCAEEALKKADRDLLGEFDYCVGGDMTDVDQHYPMDDVRMVVDEARGLFDALMRLAGYSEHDAMLGAQEALSAPHEDDDALGLDWFDSFDEAVDCARDRDAKGANEVSGPKDGSEADPVAARADEGGIAQTQPTP